MAIDFKPEFDFQPESTGQSEEPKDSSMMDVAKEALKTALPSPDFNKPVTPTSSNPVMTGLEAAGQTLRDPSRLSATISQPGQVAGGKVTEELGGGIGAKAVGAVTSMALDPQTYVAGSVGELVPTAKKLAGTLPAVKDFVKNLFTKPASEAELTSMSQELASAVTNARKTVGAKLGEMRGTHEEALDRLSNIAKKGPEPETTPQEAAKMYHDYFDKQAPLMEEKGLEGKLPTMDELKGQLGVETPKPIYKGDIVEAIGPKGERVPMKLTMPDGMMKGSGDAAFDLKAPLKNPNASWSHPVDSTLSKSTLESYGYKIPGEVQLGAKPLSADPKEEIKQLVKMRQALKDQISKRTMDQQGNMVKAVSSEDERAFSAGIRRINDRMEQIPGGKEVRDQEKKFSQLADIYDDLQGKLKNPNESREFLRKMFLNPSPKMKDLRNKLEKLEGLAGTNIITNLKEAFESTKGLTYEQLKHPLASVLKTTLPEVGDALRNSVKPAMGIGAIGLKGLQTPFNTPDMQSLRDKLHAH